MKFHHSWYLVLQSFAKILQDDSIRKGYETEVVDLKTYEPEDDLDNEVSKLEFWIITFVPYACFLFVSRNLSEKESAL